MNFVNPATLIDGYKIDHRRQYPDKTTRVYSNLTPRMSRIDSVDWGTLAGLQYFLDQYMIREMGRFFAEPRDKVLARYKRRIDAYLGPNDVGTDHIGALHELGHMPLEFRAIPEGRSVPIRVPWLTLENTDDYFGWLTNYIESLMSCEVWMPCQSATTAGHLRKLLDAAAEKTGVKEFVQWQGHDFSFRGMPGIEAAMLSGMGHLIHFTGTDTIPALDLIEEFYPDEDPNYLIGASVPATEHSVMCAGGEDGELQTFNRLLDLYPSGVLSVVSDTWDLWHVLTGVLPQLKERIMARQGKLVIRPDSGDPVKIICGDKDASDVRAYKGVVELLCDAFGHTLVNGYKLADGHVGCIYGDSITYERAKDILEGLAAKGYSSANVVFGVGSYTYQGPTRDTLGQAMKATHCVIDGRPIDIFKKPKTDNGVKNSAKGRLAVVDVGGVPTLINQATPEQEAKSMLRPVWRDGKFIKKFTFREVRANAASDPLVK